MRQRFESNPKMKKSVPAPTNEEFEELLSSDYMLSHPVAVNVYRYKDGSMVIHSPELGIAAEGDDEYEARREFSIQLIQQFEDLEDYLQNGGSMTSEVQKRLNLLGDLLREKE
jgi:hypothetical protein